MTPKLQASAQRGDPPQRSHFTGFADSEFQKTAPKGQASTQAMQEMQSPSSTTVVPEAASEHMAPVGQARAQEGDSHWRHQVSLCPPPKTSSETLIAAAFLSWRPDLDSAQTV